MKPIAFTEYGPPDILRMELYEAGKVVPVIDRRYPLSEAAEALRYNGGGDVRGNIVITVGRDSN